MMLRNAQFFPYKMVERIEGFGIATGHFYIATVTPLNFRRLTKEQLVLVKNLMKEG
jgi:hypothetical protein